MNTCPKCLRESLTTKTLNSGRDLCPAAFLAGLGVHIDVGSCLKLENSRLSQELSLARASLVEQEGELDEGSDIIKRLQAENARLEKRLALVERLLHDALDVLDAVAEWEGCWPGQIQAKEQAERLTAAFPDGKWGDGPKV